jgi:large subunit ribosomal protein L17
MSQYRKLGRPTDQRIALLRGQVTELLNKGKIITTDTRAKEVRSIAEKLITLAVRECENTVEVTKSTQNDKNQTVEITVKNDSPSRLHARRQVMEILYKVPLTREEDETKKEFAARSNQIKNPVVDKLFDEIGPKYKKRAEEKGQRGGYTRILKMGPRRGDAAEMVILEMVD